ncbi:MAG: hypothetical protein WDW38_010178 [Sanguina aurantia]
MQTISLFPVPDASSAPWLSAICGSLAPAALTFTVREVVHTAWALARLSTPHAPLLDALTDRLAGGSARTLPPLGVSHAAVIGWAFVRLRRRDRRVLRAVEKAVLRHSTTDINPQDACQLLWAFAASEHSCQRLTLAMLDAAAQASMRVQSMQSLLQMAWALAVLGHRDSHRRPESVSRMGLYVQLEQQQRQQQQQQLLQQHAAAVQTGIETPRRAVAGGGMRDRLFQQEQSGSDDSSHNTHTTATRSDTSSNSSSSSSSSNTSSFTESSSSSRSSRPGALSETGPSHSRGSVTPTSSRTTHPTQGYITQLSSFLLSSVIVPGRSRIYNVKLDSVSDADLATLLWASSQVAGAKSTSHQRLSDAAQLRQPHSYGASGYNPESTGFVVAGNGLFGAMDRVLGARSEAGTGVQVRERVSHPLDLVSLRPTSPLLHLARPLARDSLLNVAYASGFWVSEPVFQGQGGVLDEEEPVCA